MNELWDFKAKNGKHLFAKPAHQEIPLSLTLEAKGVKTEEDLLQINGYNSSQRINAIINAYNPTKHGQTLVFAVDIEDANRLTEAFLKKFPTLSVQSIHTGDRIEGSVFSQDYPLTQRERKTIVDDFRNKEIQLLVSVGLFLEGFDIPQIQSVFLARPTLTLRIYAQMVGRGLRGPAVEGTDTCHVIDFRHNFHDLSEHLISYQDLQDFWNETDPHSAKLTNQTTNSNSQAQTIGLPTFSHFIFYDQSYFLSSMKEVLTKNNPQLTCSFTTSKIEAVFYINGKLAFKVINETKAQPYFNNHQYPLTTETFNAFVRYFTNLPYLKHFVP